MVMPPISPLGVDGDAPVDGVVAVVAAAFALWVAAAASFDFWKTTGKILKNMQKHKLSYDLRPHYFPRHFRSLSQS